MPVRKLLLACLLLGGAATVQADDIDNLADLSREQFRALSGDLSAALSYKPLMPTEPMGVIGFDVAVDAGVTQVEAGAAWRLATGDDVESLPVTRLRFTKGLPFGLDVGGFYSTVPGSNVSAYGAELRYALVEGGVATPAIGLRGAATRLNGVDGLSFDTRSLDLSISKGVGPITPYAGVGRVWSDSRYEYSGAPPIICGPGNTTARCTGSIRSDFAQTKYFAGFRLSLLAMNLVLEGDRTGDATTYSLKFGFGF